MARQQTSLIVLLVGGGVGIVFLVGVTVAVLYFNGVFESKQPPPPPNPMAGGPMMPPGVPGMPFDPNGKGMPFDPAKGLPFDPQKGPPGMRVDWQVRAIPQAACSLLTPSEPIKGADPDEKKDRISFASPSPMCTVMVTVGKLPDGTKDKDVKAYLASLSITGLKADKNLEQDRHPAIEFVPDDAAKDPERITRVIAAGDEVYQIDVMRGVTPVDRAKADEVFKSFKLTK